MQMYCRTLALLGLIAAKLGRADGAVTAYDSTTNVTYKGVTLDGIDTFLSIPYGQDTGTMNRFKPPKSPVLTAGSIIDATVAGPSCPQPLGANLVPLYLGNITEVSEDCLHLNVYRKGGTKADTNLPVLLFIHGGSFIAASKDDPVIQPGGLIKQSYETGYPVMYVSINYRLGVFGFAQSDALNDEGSENAGLRDQRLAIQWTRDNIGYFGGNPDMITILGQSSGGLAVGMQMLAYGGAKGFSFQQVSAESQFLEAGITGNFTRTAMEDVVNDSGCNSTDLQSVATVKCLRELSMKALLQSQTRTYDNGPGSNYGDKWLPVVDGDFLPAEPSQLVAEKRFANVTTMVGWCEDDANILLPSNVHTDAEVSDLVSAFLPGMTSPNVEKLLSFYPVSDFSANPSAKLGAQFFRAGRILRDIIFVCQPFLFGQALAEAGNDVYMWDQNQTILAPISVSFDKPGYGVIHTSNFAYEFHNLSHYNIYDFPSHPNRTDFLLADRQSRSWASFGSLGKPSLKREDTLLAWTTAFPGGDEIDIYVIGGPDDGLSPIEGPNATHSIAAQKLRERCGFLNQPSIIKQIGY